MLVREGILAPVIKNRLRPGRAFGTSAGSRGGQRHLGLQRHHPGLVQRPARWVVSGEQRERVKQHAWVPHAGRVFD